MAKKARKQKMHKSQTSAQQGAPLSAGAAAYLQTSPEELMERKQLALQCLEALQAVDTGKAGSLGSLQARAEELVQEPFDCTDLVDRQKALARLVHIVRMCDKAIAVQEIQRTKAFSQTATRLLFDSPAASDAPAAASWQNLFSR